MNEWINIRKKEKRFIRVGLVLDRFLSLGVDDFRVF